YRGCFGCVATPAHDRMDVNEPLLVDPELRSGSVAILCTDDPNWPAIPRSVRHNVQVVTLFAQDLCGRIHGLPIDVEAEDHEIVAQLASLPRSAIAARVERILAIDADVPVVVC